MVSPPSNGAHVIGHAKIVGRIRTRQLISLPMRA